MIQAGHWQEASIGWLELILDHRERVVGAVSAGQSCCEVARTLGG
jgi:hypothetical protein